MHECLTSSIQNSLRTFLFNNQNVSIKLVFFAINPLVISCREWKGQLWGKYWRGCHKLVGMSYINRKKKVYFSEVSGQMLMVWTRRNNIEFLPKRPFLQSKALKQTIRKYLLNRFILDLKKTISKVSGKYGTHVIKLQRTFKLSIAVPFTVCNYLSMLISLFCQKCFLEVSMVAEKTNFCR